MNVWRAIRGSLVEHLFRWFAAFLVPFVCTLEWHDVVTANRPFDAMAMCKSLALLLSACAAAVWAHSKAAPRAPEAKDETQ